MVSTMKMNACNGITRIWKIAQATPGTHWAQTGSSAIRIKMI